MRRVSFGLAIFLSAVGCKEVTSDVVSKAVQAGKDTASGIAQGIDEGRRAGTSADGALIVSTAAELEPHGNVLVRATSEDALEVVVNNRSDQPLRLTKLDALALDPEGFALKPATALGDLTVPARAKDKTSLRFDTQGKRLAKLRLWGHDYDVAPPSAPAAP